MAFNCNRFSEAKLAALEETIAFDSVSAALRLITGNFLGWSCSSKRSYWISEPKLFG